jgi:protein-tyrosine phosphatase
MEFLLRRQAELRNLDWQVSSAGIEAAPGVPPHPHSVEILAERGIDTSGWLSRPVQQEALDRAQLVLTATEEQREVVERMDPRTINRTFPLMQFAFLARSLRPPRMVAAAELGEWLLSESYWRRKRLNHFPMTMRDLEDPIGRPVNRFRQCAQLIDRAYADILAPGPPSRRV